MRLVQKIAEAPRSDDQVLMLADWLHVLWLNARIAVGTSSWTVGDGSALWRLLETIMRAPRAGAAVAAAEQASNIVTVALDLLIPGSDARLDLLAMLCESKQVTLMLVAVLNWFASAAGVKALVTIASPDGSSGTCAHRARTALLAHVARVSWERTVETSSPSNGVVDVMAPALRTLSACVRYAFAGAGGGADVGGGLPKAAVELVCALVIQATSDVATLSARSDVSWAVLPSRLRESYIGRLVGPALIACVPFVDLTSAPILLPLCMALMRAIEPVTRRVAPAGVTLTVSGALFDETSTTVAESDHPLRGGASSDEVKISVPGAHAVMLMFDEKCFSRRAFQLYSKPGRAQKDRIGGEFVNNAEKGLSTWPLAPVFVKGDAVYFGLAGQGPATYTDDWGWRVKCVGVNGHPMFWPSCWLLDDFRRTVAFVAAKAAAALVAPAASGEADGSAALFLRSRLLSGGLAFDSESGVSSSASEAVEFQRFLHDLLEAKDGCNAHDLADALFVDGDASVIRLRRWKQKSIRLVVCSAFAAMLKHSSRLVRERLSALAKSVHGGDLRERCADVWDQLRFMFVIAEQMRSWHIRVTNALAEKPDDLVKALRRAVSRAAFLVDINYAGVDKPVDVSSTFGGLDARGVLAALREQFRQTSTDDDVLSRFHASAAVVLFVQSPMSLRSLIGVMKQRRERAASRVIGLHALHEIFVSASSRAISCDVLAVFVESLRSSADPAGTLRHPVEDLRGCGEILLREVRGSFHTLLAAVVGGLDNAFREPRHVAEQSGKEGDSEVLESKGAEDGVVVPSRSDTNGTTREALLRIAAMRFTFGADDFDLLLSARVLSMLRGRPSWGSMPHSGVFGALKLAAWHAFKFFALSVLCRATDGRATELLVADVASDGYPTNAPLVRATSIVDVSVLRALLFETLNAITEELERADESYRSCGAPSWSDFQVALRARTAVDRVNSGATGGVDGARPAARSLPQARLPRASLPASWPRRELDAMSSSSSREGPPAPPVVPPASTDEQRLPPVLLPPPAAVYSSSMCRELVAMLHTLLSGCGEQAAQVALSCIDCHRLLTAVLCLSCTAPAPERCMSLKLLSKLLGCPAVAEMSSVAVVSARARLSDCTPRFALREVAFSGRESCVAVLAFLVDVAVQARRFMYSDCAGADGSYGVSVEACSVLQELLRVVSFREGLMSLVLAALSRVPTLGADASAVLHDDALFIDVALAIVGGDVVGVHEGQRVRIVGANEMGHVVLCAHSVRGRSRELEQSGGIDARPPVAHPTVLVDGFSRMVPYYELRGLSNAVDLDWLYDKERKYVWARALSWCISRVGDQTSVFQYIRFALMKVLRLGLLSNRAASVGLLFSVRSTMTAATAFALQLSSSEDAFASRSALEQRLYELREFLCESSSSALMCTRASARGVVDDLMASFGFSFADAEQAAAECSGLAASVSWLLSRAVSRTAKAVVEVRCVAIRVA